ncbi:unnamed protein product [Angiostrongylus costaricensis]|uniref:N-terminal Ras-GEF domain-containing protein n=1 Tax=Angiostrongylus costaricensis TaxID=334426 RepID=A0A0R3PWR0_ANGCS|nr:unnamed protein product [Angiostrongylus costaricensis]
MFDVSHISQDEHMRTQLNKYHTSAVVNSFPFPISVGLRPEVRLRALQSVCEWSRFEEDHQCEADDLFNDWQKLSTDV